MENFTIKRSFYDSRPRLLSINSEEISYENTNLKNNPITTLKKNQIKGIRHGIEFIRGFEFTIGRIYYIFIKDDKGKELKIDFKLFYGIKLQEKHNLYCDILDSLWKHHFYEIVDNFVEEASQRKNNSICGVTFEDKRIVFDEKEILIEDLAFKKYHHYFIIYSKKDQNINKMLYYLKDENSVILLEILANIIKKHEQH